MSPQKIKVGVFTRPIDQGTSGSGSHLNKLFNQILDLNPPGMELVLVHYESTDKPIYQRTSQLLIPRNPWRAARILERENFDLLHYNPLTVLSPLWVSQKVKKVATIHGAAPHFLPDFFPRSTRLQERYLRPWLARQLDFIFTVSHTSEAFLAEKYGIAKEKFAVIYNAVEPDFRVLSEASFPILERLRLKGAFIFHLSKFSERKNPWTILRAFARLHQRHPELLLVLGGSGWENPRVTDFLREHQLQDHVRFTGFIAQSELVELLNRALVFVFPSLYEGFGMPNLEAMACDCPVITSRAFAIPEIVGEAALLLDQVRDDQELANKVERLIQEPEWRQQLIERGRQHVRGFSWEKSARIVVDKYFELCSRAKKYSHSY
ncbi:MAG: glycosyltransferase family 1 protein [Bacteroidota bacterium]